jgi:hypothetical protein
MAKAKLNAATRLERLARPAANFESECTMYKYAVLWALCLGAPHVIAGELVDLQAESVEIGGFRGVVYYTSDHDGYRVVATIAEGETGLPVRFEAVLAEAQKITISVPGKLGDMSHVLELSRAGDKIVVSEPQLPPIVAAKAQPPLKGTIAVRPAALNVGSNPGGGASE